MTLRIYNTLTRKKEVFEPLETGKVSMYVCGPTVYDKAHVGHAMSVIIFDIIRRYLEYSGYSVRHVMNYTDVDDKIIQRANDLHIDPIKLAEKYIAEFGRHLEELNVLPATVFPRATHEIDQIIAMVKGLIEKGHAYEVDGDVYFIVESDKEYGKLSGRKIEDMQSGSRIDIDQRKKSPMDFALWKASKPGEPAWESPWGKGRPGWHIECSAMNLHHLGEQIDIHGGGNDLIFPHHENEIAQSECFTGKPFAKYWVHNGMLQLSGEKMSKSIGNLITIEEFLENHEADVLRMMILNSSYHSPLTYNEETLNHAARALDRLRSALRPAQPEATGEPPQSLLDQIEATRKGFAEAMDDDFNTSAAIAHLFELVRAINQARDNGAGQQSLASAQSCLLELTGVLGLRLAVPEKKASDAAPFIELLLKLRTELRTQKMWALSDTIRDELNAHGVVIEDHKNGTSWRWK